VSLGYCVFTFEGGDWSHDNFDGLEEGFRQAKRLGYDYAEVPSYLLVDRPRTDHEFTRRMNRIFEMSSKHAVPLSAIFLSVNLLNESRRRDEIDEILTVTRLASTAGIRYLPMTIGHRQELKGLDAAVELARVLSEVGQETVKWGIKILAHPHIETPVESPEQIAAFMDNSDPAVVGMCLDLGHVMAGGGDPLQFIERYGSRIDYVHLKDIDLKAYAGATGQAKYAAFRDPGHGDGDFPAFVAALSKIHFAGPWLAENDFSPDPVLSMEQSLAYLRGSLGL
jgi:inosose dehydratase